MIERESSPLASHASRPRASDGRVAPGARGARGGRRAVLLRRDRPRIGAPGLPQAPRPPSRAIGTVRTCGGRRRPLAVRRARLGAHPCVFARSGGAVGCGEPLASRLLFFQVQGRPLWPVARLGNLLLLHLTFFTSGVATRTHAHTLFTPTHMLHLCGCMHRLSYASLAL